MAAGTGTRSAEPGLDLRLRVLGLLGRRALHDPGLGALGVTQDRGRTSGSRPAFILHGRPTGASRLQERSQVIDLIVGAPASAPRGAASRALRRHYPRDGAPDLQFLAL